MGEDKELRIGLVFTLDYEIHGNGSGEFENWAYLPTSMMLNVLEEYGAKLTIMAEMGHYWAMKKYSEFFKNEIDLFESQLKETVRRGHDVQMHYHPQWIDATYHEGNWELDFSRNSIERLCHNYEEAYFYLKKGKDELERLLRPENPDYRCICFRAGFLQMQPSEIMMRALTNAGFLSDSSVSKGMKVSDSLRGVDYTNAYSKFKPWRASHTDICQVDGSSAIYEFPLLSYSVGFFNKVISKLSNIKKERNINDVISGFMGVYGRGMMPSNKPLSIKSRLKNILEKRWYYADFCQREHTELSRYMKMVISESKRNNDQRFVPVVMIGHSKDFFFANNLRSFLQSCQKMGYVGFYNYSESVRKFTS